MRRRIIFFTLILLFVNTLFAQDRLENSGIRLTDNNKETLNIWSLNLLFSDNGFALGATIYKQFSTNISGFGSIFISGAKDDREFESIDAFGNSYVPSKVNRQIGRASCRERV